MQEIRAVDFRHMSENSEGSPAETLKQIVTRLEQAKSISDFHESDTIERIIMPVLEGVTVRITDPAKTVDFRKYAITIIMVSPSLSKRRYAHGPCGN